MLPEWFKEGEEVCFAKYNQHYAKTSNYKVSEEGMNGSYYTLLAGTAEADRFWDIPIFIPEMVYFQPTDSLIKHGKVYGKGSNSVVYSIHKDEQAYKNHKKQKELAVRLWLKIKEDRLDNVPLPNLLKINAILALADVGGDV